MVTKNKWTVPMHAILIRNTYRVPTRLGMFFFGKTTYFQKPTSTPNAGDSNKSDRISLNKNLEYTQQLHAKTDNVILLCK